MSSKRCLRRASPTSPLAWNRSTCRGRGLQTNQQCMFGRHFFALQGPHEIIKETVSVHCGAVGLRWPDKSCSNLLCASHPSCANATHSQTRLVTGNLGGGRRAGTRPSPNTVGERKGHDHWATWRLDRTAPEERPSYWTVRPHCDAALPT